MKRFCKNEKTGYQGTDQSNMRLSRAIVATADISSGRATKFRWCMGLKAENVTCGQSAPTAERQCFEQAEKIV